MRPVETIFINEFFDNINDFLIYCSSIPFQEALDYVANNDLRMKIECTFIQHYLNNYAPQYKKFLAKL